MDLFDYGDYRDFIRDYFQGRKLQDETFSMTRLGNKAGISKVAVKYVMDGKRHIASETAERWAECLGLKGDEAQFFSNLVMFNKARSHTDRTNFFNRMLELKGKTLRSRYLDTSTIGPDGRRCNSRWLAQRDHAQPFALGGSSVDPHNIRYRCFAHNILTAVDTFGPLAVQSHTTASGYALPRSREATESNDFIDDYASTVRA